MAASVLARLWVLDDLFEHLDVRAAIVCERHHENW